MIGVLITLLVLWALFAILGFGAHLAAGLLQALFWVFLALFVITLIWSFLTRRLRVR